MIARILEPEIMEDEMQVMAYSNANFKSSDQLFIGFFLNDSSRKIDKVLDLGCGTADLDIELVKQLDDVHILAVDGSSKMLDIARQRIRDEKLSDSIEVKIGRLPNLEIAPGDYDIIVSKDLLHHIPDPLDFWREVERLSNDNTLIYVMDLVRPESQGEAKRIVETVAQNEPEILKLDFYNSLLAAFTIEEIKAQIKKTSLNYRIDKLGERHFIVRCKK